MFTRALACLLFVLSCVSFGQETISRRGIFYSPAISKEHIVFVRGEKLWRVPRDGGRAMSLGAPANYNSLPKFSPDGKTVALLTTFDGAFELGTVSIEGGPVHRVTRYPRNGKGLMQWLPGDRLLYFTEADFRVVESQIYTVPAKGGLPQKVPVPYGAEASIDASGEWLAYILHLRRDLYWKRYEGGMAPDIWLYNLKTGKSKQITTWKGYDVRPMWHGKHLYYMSNEGPEHAMNVWVYDMATGKRRQVTHKTRHDMQTPYMSLETDEICYAWGGEVWVLDLNTEKERRIHIEIPRESQTIETRKVDAANWLVSRTLSPNGDRVVTEARGDLWVTPAAGGPSRNLTSTDGVFERDPAWSPDGKWIACFSDETGEYQLTLISPDGQKRTLTSFKTGFRQSPRWSPDSRHIAFTDDASRCWVCTVGDGKVKQFDADTLGQVNPLSWSPDSRWITYHKFGANSQMAVWVYNVQADRKHQLTSGMSYDAQPAFDASGNYLFYFSVRDFNRRVGQVVDRATVDTTPVVIMAVPLRRGMHPPSAATLGRRPQVDIDIEGFEGRAVPLGVPSGRFSSLAAGSEGKLFYLRTDPMSPSRLQMFDLRTGGAQKMVIEGSGAFELSPDGSKILNLQNGQAYVWDAAPDQKLERELPGVGFDTTIMPTREWAQVARDVWRLFRDYFYDPGMHGLDWPKQWSDFQGMFALCATREDVNYVLGEVIGDLNVGHAMMTGFGDVPSTPWVAPGQLGCDFELVNGAFRISKVYRGAAWDTAGMGPLSQPGAEVQEGEYLLEVNGKPLDTALDPWLPFMGLAGKPVTITVGPNPRVDSASRKVEVRTLERETDLRLRAWVEKNRQYVEKMSDGKLGYIYLPDQAAAGNAEFARQFYAQTDKQGLIVDVRWTTGGTSSDRMIEMLNRPLLNAITERYTTRSFPVPGSRIPGPKALLINRVTSSSGENFAFYWRKSGLGKLIGTRTWGGLIGVNGNQALIDGGFWWIPQAAFFIDEKTWMPEGVGVAPDIEVMDDPALMRNGRDPQLDVAIEHLLKEIKRVGEKPIVPPPVRKGKG